VIRDAIVDLRRAGTTIVFSTHDMDVAEKMCDSIFMLHQGRKVLDGTLEEIQKQFGADTVRVRVASGSTVAFDRLPAVARVNDFGRFQELRMTPGGDPQAILRALTGQATIELFEVAVPRLHDIFVRIAGEPGQPPARQRMHRIWIIARREYRATVRSKAFVVSLVLMPLLLGGGALAQKAMRGRVDLEDKRLEVWDRTGVLLPVLVRAAEERNNKDTSTSPPGTSRAAYVVASIPWPALDDQRRLELSERIRRRHLHAFAEIDAEVFAPGKLPKCAFTRRASCRVIWRVGSGASSIRPSSRNACRRRTGSALVARMTAPVRIAPAGLFARAKSGQVDRATATAGRRPRRCRWP